MPKQLPCHEKKRSMRKPAARSRVSLRPHGCGAMARALEGSSCSSARASKPEHRHPYPTPCTPQAIRSPKCANATGKPQSPTAA